MPRLLIVVSCLASTLRISFLHRLSLIPNDLAFLVAGLFEKVVNVF